jgi:hypothetical protein
LVSHSKNFSYENVFNGHSIDANNSYNFGNELNNIGTNDSILPTNRSIKV